MNDSTLDDQNVFKAREFGVEQWIDANGNISKAIKLSDFEGKFKVVYCFQSWCQGCHSRGFPTLKEMVTALEGNQNIVFLSIQTVFEGYDTNTYDKILETQNQYDLKIPFGHDPGDESSNNISKIMINYRTGGTPWFIFIDQNDNVVFADFHLNVQNAINFLNTI
ncbi:redoxin domain-containing protein [Arenibacter sp. F26102]|uniref:TlpA family protein disulfide reductase n=1 Tax=Arenibacter sp. F26102 TaxID=2926416 RepID=UPI001FF0F794|nr:redoxin domain-containing protein [Arenibacter sp. F26102]MCK0146408.1 redoxin domain-containing protein [Arenibacter sp. F26102]